MAEIEKLYPVIESDEPWPSEINGVLEPSEATESRVSVLPGRGVENPPSSPEVMIPFPSYGLIFLFISGTMSYFC